MNTSLKFSFMFVLLVAAVGLSQDAGPPPFVPLKKIGEKAGAANLETSLKRAVERAKNDGKRRSTSISRATVTPSDVREHQAYLVIVEFKDGTLGLFQGGSEEENDQYVAVEKDQTGLVCDAAGRGLPK